MNMLCGSIITTLFTESCNQPLECQTSKCRPTSNSKNCHGTVYVKISLLLSQ